MRHFSYSPRDRPVKKSHYSAPIFLPSVILSNMRTSLPSLQSPSPTRHHPRTAAQGADVNSTIDRGLAFLAKDALAWKKSTIVSPATTPAS